METKMMAKYQITGVTEEGDSWTFATDDQGRALEMYAQMKQDFEEVKMQQAGYEASA
jgi:hypothetical protein